MSPALRYTSVANKARDLSPLWGSVPYPMSSSFGHKSGDLLISLISSQDCRLCPLPLWLCNSHHRCNSNLVPPSQLTPITADLCQLDRLHDNFQHLCSLTHLSFKIYCNAARISSLFPLQPTLNQSSINSHYSQPVPHVLTVHSSKIASKSCSIVRGASDELPWII